MRATVSRESFEKLSFKAIGQTITACPSHLPSQITADQEPDDAFYAAMAVDYDANLLMLAGKTRMDLDRHIPCHLFRGDHGVGAFDVGPVAFRPRGDWIAAFVIEPPVLEILVAWDRGELTRDEIRGRIRDNPDDFGETDALEILDFLGTHSWVATIRIEGHEPNRSHEKASAIVGLAIEAIGLRFPLDGARALTKSGRPHLFNEVRLASMKNGAFLRGWTASRPGIGGRPNALAAKMKGEKPFLDAAGILLGAYVTDRNTGKAVHIVERWAKPVGTPKAYCDKLLAGEMLAVIDVKEASAVAQGVEGLPAEYQIDRPAMLWLLKECHHLLRGMPAQSYARRAVCRVDELLFAVQA